MLLPILTVAGPAPVDIGAILIAVLFLVRSALTGDWQWLRARWVQLLLVLWASMVLRNLPLDASATARAAGWLRYPVFAAALAFWALQNALTRHWLGRTLLAAVIFLVGDTLLQYASGTDLFGRPALLHEGALRMSGPFSAPRVGITIVWLLFPALLACLAAAAPRARAFGFLLALAAAAAVLGSGERTALILLLFGFAASFALLPRARLLLLIAAMLGAAGGWGMMQLNPTLHARQVGKMQQEVGGFAGSVYGRTWLAGAAITRDHLLFGVGSKQFQPTCQQPRYGATDESSLRNRCPMHPHNMYVEWAVEYGLIGLALWLATCLSWLALAWRARAQWWRAPVATGLLIAVAIKLFPIAVVPSQFVAWSATPLWLMAGWLLALLSTTRDNTLDARP